MARPRAGDRFTCTLGVVKTHFGWFPTDLGPMKIFEILTFFEKNWEILAGPARGRRAGDSKCVGAAL